MKTLLYGVTGIGYGHTFRQLPIIEHVAKKMRVMIFAYDKSYTFFSKHFKGNKNVRVERIAVPFWTGGPNGLDFEAARKEKQNQTQRFVLMNMKAMSAAQSFIGKPHLVITDYEPISAQYAYAYNAPLITIDQQSKYLYGDFPTKLGGFTFQDEIARLHMFFPKVEQRIACSFFNVTKRKNSDNILLFPPTIRESIKKIQRTPRHNDILVYVSSARDFVQSIESVIEVCKSQPQYNFHIFTKEHPKEKLPKNILLHKHGSAAFENILATCSGIVTSAGHSLLSEAMYLGIPICAIPVSPYEQHLNARIIHEAQFGLSAKKISTQTLSKFLKHIDIFATNIKADTHVLMRGIGQEQIISYLESKFL